MRIPPKKPGKYVSKPKIKSVPYDEAFDRLYGSGKTINSNSTSDELPDGYEWNEKKTKVIPKDA
tara:strand:- start:326 stop:517 length:192 start_codon:yes stop_codon:yes gene_type:complete